MRGRGGAARSLSRPDGCAARRCWLYRDAWPASAELKPTPSMPITGPATGVPQDTRRTSPIACNHHDSAIRSSHPLIIASDLTMQQMRPALHCDGLESRCLPLEL